MLTLSHLAAFQVRLVNDEVKHLENCGRRTTMLAFNSKSHIAPLVITDDKSSIARRPYNKTEFHVYVGHKRHAPWTISDGVKVLYHWKQRWNPTYVVDDVKHHKHVQRFWSRSRSHPSDTTWNMEIIPQSNHPVACQFSSKTTLNMALVCKRADVWAHLPCYGSCLLETPLKICKLRGLL